MVRRVYEEMTQLHMTTIHCQLKPSVGVVLLDAQLRLVHYTAEAATILGYTSKLGDSVPLDFVKAATRFQLANPSKAAAAAEFTSGRRRYRCRAFLLDSNGNGNGNGHGNGHSARAPGPPPSATTSTISTEDRRCPRACVYTARGYHAMERGVSTHDPRVRNRQVVDERAHQ